MYETGRGVPKNNAQAVVWYRKAAAQNDELAKMKLVDPAKWNLAKWNLLRKGMSKEEARALLGEPQGIVKNSVVKNSVVEKWFYGTSGADHLPDLFGPSVTFNVEEKLESWIAPK